jgi:hypothetical protein
MGLLDFLVSQGLDPLAGMGQSPPPQ